MRNAGPRYLAVIALAAAALAALTAQSRPRLVVLISVDQMRADYVDRLQHQWTRGLRRLVDRGAWFPEAAYPYLNTVTCAGHATMATGTLPAVHGQVLNAWWDRDTQKMVACTDDRTVRGVSYGADPGDGARQAHSAVRLKVPTLADEMRAQLRPPSRVVTMSLKARSAIMLAGHRGDVVTWFDNTRGEWATSTAFSAAPVPHLAMFFAQRPFRSDFGKTWARLLPLDRYLPEDSGLGKAPPVTWGPSLPHELRGEADGPDRAFYEQWESSPFSDAYLADMAIASIDALGLGSGGYTDYLGVSFSALDKVGHDFGPFSLEVQDVLAQLDVSIGRLFDVLDARVGLDHYVVGFTADHGVAPIPDQMQAQGADAGRIDTRALGREIESLLAMRYGPGKHVARVEYTDLYFAPGVYARLVADGPALAAVTDAIGQRPGIMKVYRGDRLASLAAADETAAAALRSYTPERSGDLILVPKPYWIMSEGSAATHGTFHAYDRRVPVMLMGTPFKPGRYSGAASPADLAPTLAHTIGVTLGGPHGRVLSEAIRTEATPAREKTAGR